MIIDYEGKSESSEGEMANIEPFNVQTDMLDANKKAQQEREQR